MIKPIAIILIFSFLLLASVSLTVVALLIAHFQDDIADICIYVDTQCDI
jgi:hypothetical protein